MLSRFGRIRDEAWFCAKCAVLVDASVPKLEDSRATNGSRVRVDGPVERLR